MLHPARSLYFPRQPDTLLSHDYQYSRLNQLECNYAKKSKVSIEQGFRTCRDIEEEKPLHEKVLFLCKFPLIERHALRLK